MRSAIAKHIRRRVEQYLKQYLPMFGEVKEAELPPESRLYAWKVSDRFWWYLFLMFRDDGDWFRLRLSWSTKGKFQTRFGGLHWPPEEDAGIALGHLGFPPATKLAAIDGGHDLAPPRVPGDDPSDLSWLDPVPVDQAIGAADAALNAEFDSMLKFGIPYMEEVRKQRGE